MRNKLLLKFSLILYLSSINNSFGKTPSNSICIARQLMEEGYLNNSRKILSAIKFGNNKIFFDKYILSAEIAYKSGKIELFKSFTDSAFLCFQRPNIRPIYLALVYRNYSRYFHYNIVVNEAERYADSAMNIFYQNYKQRDLIPIYSLFQAKASALRNRYRQEKKVSLMFDSAFYWLNRDSKKSLYDCYLLNRSYGNFLLDGLVGKSNLGFKKRSAFYKNTEAAYRKCIQILQANFKNNKIELSDVFILQALAAFLNKDYRKAHIYLNKSIYLLGSIIEKESMVLQSYYTALNYQNSVIDYALKSEDARLYRIKYFERLISRENDWIEWTFNNRNKQTGEFRLMYSCNYYSVMLNNSYHLYLKTKKNKYKQWFYYYLQKSKALFFGNNIRQIQSYKPHISNIASIINDSSAYIEYASTSLLYEHANFAYIKTSVKDTIIEIGHAHLDKYAEIFLSTDSLFKSFNYFKKNSFEVYKELLDPILKIIPKKINKLSISMSNNTSFFNFDYLVIDSVGTSFRDLPYLFYKYKINYLPPIAMNYFQNTKNYSANSFKSRIVYAPNFSRKHHNLPFLVNHAKSLKKIGFTIIDDNKDEKNDLSKSLLYSDILELIGHCKTRNNGFVSDFEIELSDTESNIKVSDLLNYQTNSKLVILALCEAGRGELHRSDIGNNIANYFIKIGAKSVVYSITKLDDKSASYILDKFYFYLIQGNYKDEALRKAKIDYLNKSKVSDEFCPLYWAALVVQGNMDPIFNNENRIDLNKETNTTKWIIFILFMAIGFTIYFRLLK